MLGSIKRLPFPEVLINCCTCDPLHMRINNVLHWYCSNLSSQLNCTWQANLKEHISVWEDHGRGYRYLNKKGTSEPCMKHGAASKASRYQISHSAKDVREKKSVLVWKSIKVPLIFCFIIRCWFVSPAFSINFSQRNNWSLVSHVRLQNDLSKLAEKERISRIKCRRITPLHPKQCRYRWTKCLLRGKYTSTPFLKWKPFCNFFSCDVCLCFPLRWVFPCLGNAGLKY